MRREEILQHVQTLLDVEDELRQLHEEETVAPVKARLKEALEDLRVAGLRLKEASLILLGTEQATSNK